MSYTQPPPPPRPVYVGFQSPEKASRAPDAFGADGAVASSGDARATHLSDPILLARHAVAPTAVSRTPPRTGNSQQRNSAYQESTATATATAAAPSAARFEYALPSMQIASSLQDESDHFEPSSAASAYAAHHAATAAAATRPAYTANKYASPRKSTTIAAPQQPSMRAATAASSALPSSSSAAPLGSASAPALPLSSMLPVVQSFLQSLYPGDLQSSMPSCEINAHTVQSLYALQQHVKDNEERADILEEEMREASKEYAAEGHTTADT